MNKLHILVFIIFLAIFGVSISSLSKFDQVGTIEDYEPAIAIKIVDGDKEEKEYLIQKNTVENVLNDLEITLDNEDSVNLQNNDQVSEGTQIVITRVTYQEVTEQQNIAYETQYVDSDDKTLFGTRVKQEGVPGILSIVYKARFVNGKEVSREELRRETIKEPIAKIVEEGTVSTGVTFTGRLTRYGADCYGCGNRTAAGLYVTVNGVKDAGKVTLTYGGGEYYVLAADSSIPFGTIVKVSNHGFTIPDPFYGIVLDRGGAVTGTSMDVFCGGESSSFFSGGTTYNTVFEIISVGSGATGIY